MSQTKETTARQLTNGVTSRAAWQHLRLWTRRLRAWRLQRGASRQLLALSDAGLKDLGLHRSEVNSRLLDWERRRQGPDR
jgi:uncharacterized protein YjiS (DUF1127 family)